MTITRSDSTSTRTIVKNAIRLGVLGALATTVHADDDPVCERAYRACEGSQCINQSGFVVPGPAAGWWYYCYFPFHPEIMGWWEFNTNGDCCMYA